MHIKISGSPFENGWVICFMFSRQQSSKQQSNTVKYPQICFGGLRLKEQQTPDKLCHC